MTDTANLGLPCIEGSQAQKHVTHNEALRIIDTLVHLAVEDRDLAAPPATPGEGDRFIVKAGATGAWTGHDGKIAAWQDGGWQFSAPRPGWLAYILDEGALLVWSGSAWIEAIAAPNSLNNMALLGVGTTADAANPLSAKLNNALFAAKTVAEGGDGNLRYKLSKESAAKTLSFLFQDSWSGRAEIGLTGDDDLHVKVSPDGSAWTEAIRIDRNSGKVMLPANGASREMLTSDRTYYVRTDGSNANDGLADAAGGAFLTIQKAIDTVFGTLDLGSFNVTIQLGDGTYTAGGNAVAARIGSGSVTIKGNQANPGNVIVNVPSIGCFRAASGAWLIVKDMELRTSGGAPCLVASVGGYLQFSNIRFGTSSGQHIRSEVGGMAEAIGNYGIVGGAASHFNMGLNGVIRVQGKTVSLSGTPAFSTAFAQGSTGGMAVLVGSTFSGAAAGKRYEVSLNAAVYTAQGDTFLPGDVAGTAATGGQYA